MSDGDGIDFWMDDVDEDEIKKEITSDTEETTKEETKNKVDVDDDVIQTRSSTKQNSKKVVAIDTDSEDDDDVPTKNKNSSDNDYVPNNYAEDSMANRTRSSTRIAYDLYRQNRNFQDEVSIPKPVLKTIPESDPQSTMILQTQSDLIKQLEDLQKDIDDDVSNSVKPKYVPSVIVGSDDDDVEVEDSDPTKKKLLFKTADDTFEWHLVWEQKDSFYKVMDKLPPKYREYDIKIDGTQWNVVDVFYDLVHNGDVLILIEPSNSMGSSYGDGGSHSQGGGDDNMRKVSFLMPDGTKKKIKIPLDSTWREILEKLGTGKALLFDGEEIDLDEKVGDNDEIEDEDQIDVN